MTKDEAITVLLSLKEYYNDKNEDSYVGFDDDDNETLDMAIEALEEHTRWIPCSERMPEDGDTYIVSGYEMWEGKKLPFVDCATYPGSYIDGWDTYNDWCEGQEVHIIAWQEMPEAWEDEEWK